MFDTGYASPSLCTHPDGERDYYAQTARLEKDGGTMLFTGRETLSKYRMPRLCPLRAHPVTFRVEVQS